MSELMLLSEVVCNPGGFDSLANYVGEVPDDGWLYVLSRTRDSDALEESNFRVALKRLGGEGENVEVLGGCWLMVYICSTRWCRAFMSY